MTNYKFELIKAKKRHAVVCERLENLNEEAIQLERNIAWLKTMVERGIKKVDL